MRCQRPVRSNDVPRAVVHHDVVADRVNVFHPLPLGAFQLRESPEILQRKRRMARQRMQQSLLIRAQCFSIPDQAQRPKPFIVARRDAHKHHCARLFRKRPGCRNLLRYRSGFYSALASPRGRNQPAHHGLRGSNSPRHGMKFRLASPVHRYSPPVGIEHSRRTQRKLSQEIRQIPRLRRLDRQLHQLVRVAGLRPRELRPPTL